MAATRPMCSWQSSLNWSPILLVQPPWTAAPIEQQQQNTTRSRRAHMTPLHTLEHHHPSRGTCSG
eukprot:scaffold130208_cov69-Phaeocystis_antarctica.AAC.7